MRERELRLALVCYGGVSLAIYMHGVTGEIQKLVRASRAFHEHPDPAEARGRSFSDSPCADDFDHDTESEYFELLKLASDRVALRVIVDVVAGASAGGINGVMLARGLAHNLPIGPLRTLWLEEADVTRLLARESIATKWSKWFLQPFIWGFLRLYMPRFFSDFETRTKLSLFVRSRWFRAPFNGRRLLRLLMRAMMAMGEPKPGGESLLPRGHRLTLFVTLTDFYGYQNALRLNDPPVVIEQEHRHVLRFDYQSFADGEVLTDFDNPSTPALAFAGRATSAFPGAFPAAQIAEVEAELERLEEEWPRRERFLRKNFQRYVRSGVDPRTISFIDGSVLNNKPFKEAIAAIRGRPAYREVDRRILYIDPDPVHLAAPPARVPGFFRTLKAALSDIPRSEPISDELEWINAHNDRVRRARQMIELSRPRVEQLVRGIVGDGFERPLDEAQIARFRSAANTLSAREAGYAYEGYIRLKLYGVFQFVVDLVTDLVGLPPGAPARQWIAIVLDRWTAMRGMSYAEGTLHEPVKTNGDLQPWVTFLLSFDVGYRERRLRFVIQSVNALYPRLGKPELAGLDARFLDRLKRRLYEALDAVRQHGNTARFDPATGELARALFADAGEAAMARDLDERALGMVAREDRRLTELMDRLAKDVGLRGVTDQGDAILAAIGEGPAAMVRREAMLGYLGFAFWDVLTFGISDAREIGEFNEIKVDRISPEDTRLDALKRATGELKGRDLRHFGAFFSRSHREHDYLWGRLHTIDRLFDLVADAAAVTDAGGRRMVDRLKVRALRRVLKIERPRLQAILPLIEDLERRLAAAETAGDDVH
ncbi:MAG: patatin-like protein [Alphaproteobacteria bacterium]|nr:patatin-like protein [Alphaproteobacteria bacterium]